MFTDDQLRYHAKKGGFPANALAEELLRVRALVGEWRADAAANDGSFWPEHQTVAMILEDCADDLEQVMKEENDG